MSEFFHRNVENVKNVKNFEQEPNTHNWEVANLAARSLERVAFKMSLENPPVDEAVLNTENDGNFEPNYSVDEAAADVKNNDSDFEPNTIEDDGYSDGYENDYEDGHSDSYEDSYEDEDDEDYDDEEYYDNDNYYESHSGEERIELKEENLRIGTIPLPDYILERYNFLKELPDGIAVMGGVARSITREIITGDREPVRDIDLINILDENGKSAVNSDTLDQLGQKFMPDDYAFGHGIENDTLEHYFASRDFTINQSLILGGKLLISDVAYNDFQENIIRPTYFELPFDGDNLSGRLFLKALMMRSVLSQVTESIPLLEEVNHGYIGSFDVALFLNKAMSRGAETACIFTEDLAEWDVIPEEYAGRPKATAKMLLDEIYGFEFHPSADPRFIDTDNTEDLDGFFIPKAMANYYASDPKIREELAKYEDGRLLKSNLSEDKVEYEGKGERKSEERTSGRYPQSDYDEINSYAKYDYQIIAQAESRD